MSFREMSLIAVSVGFLALMGEATRADAFGWGRRHEGPPYTRHYQPPGRYVRDLPHGHARMFLGGLEFFYWEGLFYRLMEDRYVVVPAPVGAVVTTIPSGAQTVIVDGTPYYFINGVAYMQTSTGYQVVPQPRAVPMPPPPPVEEMPPANAGVGSAPAAPPPAANAEESFTVNIPNSKGGYTAVVLKRSGNGFIGPQGEYYPEFPKVEQLKLMYAK
jgi:hypothetical protein